MSENTETTPTFVDKLKSNKDVIIKRSLLVGGVVAGIAITAGLLSKKDDDFYDDLDDEPVGEDVEILVDGTESAK